jgi:lysophospholipid acyltransferase (LPLAT)-like uncharacterized protein
VKGLLRKPWVQALLGRVLAGYLILIRRTTRWRHEGLEALEPMFASGQGAIGLFWHGRIPICLGMAETWWRKDSRRCLVSPSSDGEFVALALEYAGFPAIRMSTAKKGDSAKARAAVAAFREAVQHVAGGGVLIITPDGPRGPNEEVAAGALQIARSLLKQEDPALARRYRALAELPHGSLGRAYLAFIDANGFSVPGELGGPPPPVVRHDCCHVLGGYGTSPSEECGVLGFQAGFGRNDPFFTILFGLAQFQLGIGSTPVTAAETGQADPEVIFRGLEHGLGVTRDLISDWDPWDDFPRPLEEVRRQYGIRPRQSVGAEPAP